MENDLFEQTQKLVVLLKSLASKRGDFLFGIKLKYREQADEAVTVLLDKYKSQNFERSDDALHGIMLARKRIRDEEAYCLANFLEDLEYYSDRWCLYKVTRMMVLWEHVIRLN